MNDEVGIHLNVLGGLPISSAIKIFQGKFGRVALLDMTKPLVGHAHHHCHVLIKGSGADTFFSVRGRRQSLTAETAVLVNAWERHAYEHHQPATTNSVILALYIEPFWLAEIQRQLTVSSHPHFFPRACVEISRPTRCLADDLATEMLLAVDIPPARLEAHLFELMISIIDPYSDWRNFGELTRTTRQQSTDPRIRRALTLMRDNVDNSLELETIATRCGLSRAHFFALFRKCTSLTPAIYANVLRMEIAINKLSLCDSSLAEISYNIGFSAPSHFTRFFRDNLGITPSEYRKVVDVFDRGRWPTVTGNSVIYGSIRT